MPSNIIAGMALAFWFAAALAGVAQGRRGVAAKHPPAVGDTGRVYFDARWEPCEADDATYYRRWKRVNDSAYLIRDFFSDGSPQMFGYSLTYQDSLHEFGQYTYYHSDGTKESEGYYVDGVRDGTWISWHRNGQRNDSAYYVSGDVTGIRKAWHANGRLFSEQSFVNGVAEGPARTWFEDGSPSDSGSYVGGKRHGPWHGWYRSGRDRQRLTMAAGRPDGIVVTMHENGTKRDSCRYVDGVASGPCVAWYASGARLSEGAFEAGERHGPWTWWHTNGAVLRTGSYDEGTQTGEWKEYFRTGELAATATFVPGTMLTEWTYYFRNGIVSARETYRNGRALVGATYWNEDSTRVADNQSATALPMPMAPGNDVDSFIRSVLQYPEEARAGHVSGIVTVTVLVRADGSVADMAVIGGSHPLLDDEALRAVRAIPRWRPGRLHNRLEDRWAQIAVTFRLPPGEDRSGGAP